MKYAISAATGSFGQTAVKNLVDAVGAENVGDRPQRRKGEAAFAS